MAKKKDCVSSRREAVPEASDLISQLVRFAERGRWADAT